MATRTYRMIDSSVTTQKIVDATGIEGVSVIFDGLPTATLSVNSSLSELQISQLDSHMLDSSWVPVT